MIKTFTCCSPSDVPLMIEDGYKVVSDEIDGLVLMQKDGEDTLVYGVSERVWIKKLRRHIIKYRFTVYNGKTE